ncbi:MAG: pyridoxal phosphate-dependent decarboxylase family protein [Woeseiaceae bacterium]
MSSLLNDAAARAMRYLDGLKQRRVTPDAESLAAVTRLDEALTDDGESDASTLALLDEVGSPASMAIAGPRFFGFVMGGSLPATIASNWLTTVWEQNACMHEITPAASRLEHIALDWLIEVLGLPSGTGAGFVTGTTVANFTSLAAARHRVYADVGWDVESDGLVGAPEITIIVGAEAHPTLTKSLGLLGFGRNRMLRVPVDDQGRLIAAELPAIHGPTIVCTQAGNVNTGAFDPVGEICDIVKPQGAWVHVDGAFGLWAAASDALHEQTDGLQQADSWATDAHKGLNVPYDSGIAFVRNPHDLQAAMSITAEYLVTETEFRNPSDFTPELSRRARGIDVWAALRTLGRNGLADMVNRSCKMARRFADGFSAAGYNILNEVVFNQVLVELADDATTRRIIAAIQVDGTCWCGVTVWQGRTAMRISVSNWSTTESDVDQSLAAMLRIANDFS